jgi:type II secretory pathway pseudopilin PulG
MSDKANPWLIVAIVAAVFVGVILMLGIISAIAIPNLLNAIDRGKQKRTVTDLHAIGLAIESYAVDHDHYPTATDLEELRQALQPRYIKLMPSTDGWARPFVYDGGNPEGPYMFRSLGKDGVADPRLHGGATLDFDCDIVFAEGEFLQWPKGIPR